MKNLAFCLIGLTLLSTSVFAQSMKCANGNLEISLSGITPVAGALATNDKVLSARGNWAVNGPTQTSTRMVFHDGKVRFETITLMVAIIIQHNINFNSIVKHKTTSTSGEWSTYEVQPGLFTKTKYNTYLQVNNFNKTATIFKSNSEKDVWECL